MCPFIDDLPPCARTPMSMPMSMIPFLSFRICCCAQLLREHAAVVLHKEPEKLTPREEARMAYAIGDGVYTVARLSAHLGALVAGLPTE